MKTLRAKPAKVAALVVGILGALGIGWGIVAARVSAADPVSSADRADAAAPVTAVFVPWAEIGPQLRSSDDGVAQVQWDAQGRFVAILNRLGTLRLWALTPDGRLGQQLLDYSKQRFVTLGMGWQGEILVSWRVNGVSDLPSLLDDEERYGFYEDYWHDHSTLWAWDPVGGAACAAAEGGGLPLRNDEGDLLVLCDATWNYGTTSYERRDLLVDVLAFPALSPKRSFAAPGVASILRGSGEPPTKVMELLRSSHGAGFATIVKVPGPVYEYDRHTIPVAALAVVYLDGSVRVLTDGRENRLWRELPGLPCVIRPQTEEPQLACPLQKWEGRPFRLVYLGLDGKVSRQLEVSLRTTGGPRGSADSDALRPVTCTQDGKQLLLQVVRPSGSAQPGQLYIRDLAAGTDVCAGPLPRIAEVYGWINENILVVSCVSAGRPERLALGCVRLE